MSEKEPEFQLRRRIPSFYRPPRKQRPPAPGEEFTGEWIYLARLLESIAKELSRENNHIKAVEQFERAKRIWTGVTSVHKQALSQLLSVIISLIREYVVLGRIEDAHHLCLHTIKRWEKHPLPSHQKLLLTHIRYCRALIATELTLYDEAIQEYETVFSIWKEFSKEDMRSFLPIMEQATAALQHLYLEIEDKNTTKHSQNHPEELQTASLEKK